MIAEEMLSRQEDKAFTILVRQHHRRLLAYAIGLTGREDAAKDVVQEAFIIAFSNLEKFDVSRDFGAWMRGIVRNKVREWRRSDKLTLLDDEILEAMEAHHQEWDRQAEEQDQRTFSALRSCLQRLPATLGDAVDCFYMHRMSGADTARKLATSEASIRKRLQRARTQLANCITHQLELNHG